MLLPAHGIGGVSEEFFRKAFGENLNEFQENIRMPESILMSRGKFLKKDSENIEEWEKRISIEPIEWERDWEHKEWLKRELLQIFPIPESASECLICCRTL